MPSSIKPIGLRMTRGTTPTFEVTVTKSSGKPQPLHNWTLTFTAGVTYDDATPITKTVGAGIAIIDADAGVFGVTLMEDDTSDMPNTDTVLVFDVAGSSSDYPYITLVKGTLTVEPSFAA